MEHSDIEIILKVWHGKFDHNNKQDREQAGITYDKLIALKYKLMTEGHTQSDLWVSRILSDTEKHEISKGAK